MKINNYYIQHDPKNLYLQSKLRKLLYNAINSKDNNLLYKIGNIDKLIKSGNIEEAEIELRNIEKINKSSSISLNNKLSVDNKFLDNKLYDSKGNIKEGYFNKSIEFKG
ncbi:hypothetical protein [Marinitoga sp. 38H-ov]|uniref:hypothetical protein n=1 Tax=Marinitoga sp. 38H-ov TaxID=1755814 RepID=UPI0013EDAACF|nr:hypothetical protein [Marinitoga sp. 38H-ov]KAF2955718.1 hypothetical protein AS160_00990 [Marinitoga sp. 38H-ov]